MQLEGVFDFEVLGDYLGDLLVDFVLLVVLQLLQLGHDLEPVQLLGELVALLAADLTPHKQHRLNALQCCKYLLYITGIAQYFADGLEQADLSEELGQLGEVTLVGGIAEDVADLGAHIGQVRLQHAHQFAHHVAVREHSLDFAQAAGCDVGQCPACLLPVDLLALVQHALKLGQCPQANQIVGLLLGACGDVADYLQTRHHQRVVAASDLLDDCGQHTRVDAGLYFVYFPWAFFAFVGIVGNSPANISQDGLVAQELVLHHVEEHYHGLLDGQVVGQGPGAADGGQAPYCRLDNLLQPGRTWQLLNRHLDHADEIGQPATLDNHIPVVGGVTSHITQRPDSLLHNSHMLRQQQVHKNTDTVLVDDGGSLLGVASSHIGQTPHTLQLQLRVVGLFRICDEFGDEPCVDDLLDGRVAGDEQLPHLNDSQVLLHHVGAVDGSEVGHELVPGGGEGVELADFVGKAGVDDVLGGVGAGFGGGLLRGQVATLGQQLLPVLPPDFVGELLPPLPELLVGPVLHPVDIIILQGAIPANIINPLSLIQVIPHLISSGKCGQSGANIIVTMIEAQPHRDEPWVEKYRPGSLTDLISHETILHTLRKFISEDNLPNLLFYGPPGTGKTSTIKALAKEYYKQYYSQMVLEFNASDERGIDVVRDQIKSFASTQTLSKNKSLKLIILDEADMMTPASQFALRRIIEKYAQNARFCLISNYVSRVIPALQSRCTRFKFRQIPEAAAIQRVQKICSAEHLALTSSALKAVFRLCQGDMRRIVNMLQSLSLLNKQSSIEQDDVYSFTGNPSRNAIQSYFDILERSNIVEAVRKLEFLLRENGISMQTIVQEFYQKILFTDMNRSAKTFLVKSLGEIEYRLSIGGQEKLALGSLVGAFHQARQYRPSD